MKRGARRPTAAAIGILLGSCAPMLNAAPEPAHLTVAAPQPAPPSRPGLALDGPFIQGGIALGLAPSNAVSIALDGKPVAMAPDGRFLIGFGRDAPSLTQLVVQLADGTMLRRPLAVAPRAWRIEHLTTLARQSRPSDEFLRLRAPELAEINAARRIASNSNGWRQRFVWPAIGRISGLFGSQRIYRGEPGAYHSGVDVARPTGAPVFAPADGVVVLASDRPFTLEGYLLMIDHGMGLNSAFLHLSRIDVKTGDVIRQGQLLGAVGATGRATGAHLHWGMKWQDERIDPLLLAGPMPGAQQP